MSRSLPVITCKDHSKSSICNQHLYVEPISKIADHSWLVCDEPLGPELTAEGLSRVEEKGQSVSVFCHLLSDT